MTRRGRNDAKLMRLAELHAELVELLAELEAETERLRRSLSRAGVLDDA